MNYKKTQARGQYTIFMSITFEVREGHQNLIHSQAVNRNPTSVFRKKRLTDNG